MPSFTSDNITQLSRGGDGTILGQSATDLVSFYGGTPVAQRAASIQAASVVSVASNISVLASTVAWMLEVTNTLTGLKIWKGGA
jgi:hypothetical protein